MIRSDVVGNNYGHLTVIREVSHKVINGRKYRWVVGRCVCGNEKEYKLSDIKTRKSCGCKTIEILKANATKHGMTKTRLFSIWTNMKNRCSNPKIPTYQRYGALGIAVCDEWWNSFEAFRDWAYKNGYTDELTIDRHPNKQGNYEPTNCRWATEVQQQNNKSSNRMVEYMGDRLTLAELCRKYNLVYERVQARIVELGWSVKDAVEKDKIEDSIIIANFYSPVNKKGYKRNKH